MSYTSTAAESITFTLTNARHLAAKVATDLKRIQRFYDRPTDASIADYEAEATALLKAGYLEEVTYGFMRNGSWIEPTLTYRARDLLGTSAADDDPGAIRPRRDVAGATFYSFLTYTSAWLSLGNVERAAFEGTLPFKRGGAAEPGVEGYLSQDRTYSAGGRALTRSSVKGFA